MVRLIDWISSHRSDAVAGTAVAPPYRCEPLERRTLLSQIVWLNQGSANDDSDGFNAAYGANAAAARGCVVRAMQMWSEVIVDFNYADVDPPDDNIYFLDVAAGDLGSGTRGSTGSIQDDDDDKPYYASITMDNDAGGEATGWYFDPKPSDSVEFSNIVDRDWATGGPFAGRDFMRSITHEIGHAMGIADPGDLKIGDYLFNAGIDQVALGDGDPTTNGALYVLILPNSPPLMTFTDAGGLHVYEGPPDPAFPNFPLRDNDLMNSGRGSNQGERALISDLDAEILQKVYGYTIAKPSSLFNQSFMAQLSTTSGTLSVNGDPQIPSDEIVIGRDPSAGNITVNILGEDIIFPSAATSGVVVHPSAGSDSDDHINIDLGNGNPFIGKPLFIDGGAGSNLLSFLTGDDSDTIQYSNSVFTLNGQQVAYGRQNVSYIYIEAQGGQDEITVLESPVLSGDFRVFGGDGVDQIELSPLSKNLDAFQSTVFVGGEADSDTLLIHDENNTADHTYSVGQNDVSRDALEIEYNSVEVLGLYTSSGDNTINIFATAPGTDTLVQAGTGSDSFDVKSVDSLDSIEGPLTVVGGDGAAPDSLVLTDTGDATPGDTVTLTNTTVGHEPGDSLFGPGGSMVYNGFSSLAMDLGSHGNNVKIKSTNPGTSTVLHTGTGGDTITISSTGQTDFGLADVRSPLTINGQDGIDNLRIEDKQDLDADTLTFTSSTIGNGASDTFFPTGGRVTYLALEGVQISMGSGGNTVTVESTAAAAPVTITSGNGNDFLTVDRNSLAPDDDTVNFIRSALSIFGTSGDDRVILEDSSDTTADVVTVTATQVGAGQNDTFFGGGNLTYGSIEILKLNLGTGGDSVTVTSTASKTATIINGQGGSDAITVDNNGSGASADTVDFVASSLTINGGADTNTLTYNDQTDTTADTLTVTPTQVGIAGDSFFGTGGLSSYADIATLTINMGQGGDTINLQGTNPTTTTIINAGGGNDTLNAVAPLAANVIYDGGPQFDIIQLLGILSTIVTYTPSKTDSGDGMLMIDASILQFFHLEPIIVSKLAALTLITPSGSDNINMSSPTAGQTNVSGSSDGVAFESLSFSDVGTFTLDTATNDGRDSSDHITGGLLAHGLKRLRILAGDGPNLIDVQGGVVPLEATGDDIILNVSDGAAVSFSADQTLAKLNITDAVVTMSRGAAKVLHVDDLLIQAAGKLDLRNSFMIWDYLPGPAPTAISMSQTYLTAGYNRGDWRGNGIASSSAADAVGSVHPTSVGFADATDLFQTFPATFAGQSVDSSSVLFRYTLAGDANLDARVDLTDFTIVAANFNRTGKRWSQGDFTYDGGVDLNDFTFLATNFNASLAPALEAVDRDAIGHSDDSW